MNWLDGSLINLYVSAPFRERLIEKANDLHLDQIIQVPTRSLDLCFTTHLDKVERCETFPDYCAILITFSHNIQLSRQNPKKIFLFDRANWDVIREEMIKDCENYLTLNSSSILTAKENWQYFVHTIQALLMNIFHINT